MADFEVKFLVKSDQLLGSDNSMTTASLNEFFQSASIKPLKISKMNVQFLDTEDKQIYNGGWSPRIRKSEGEDEWELTYKKRYPIVGENIQAAIDLAAKDGFKPDGGKWEFQVEWGFGKQTLSVSRSKTVPSSDTGATLPGTEESKKIVAKEAPDSFNNSKEPGWGKKKLETSRVFGPVLAKRWVGQWQGIKLYIEVWPIRDKSNNTIKQVTEVSFKETDKDKAKTTRAVLCSFLEGKGWLVKEDSLRTQLIMDNY